MEFKMEKNSLIKERSTSFESISRLLQNLSFKQPLFNSVLFQCPFKRPVYDFSAFSSSVFSFISLIFKLLLMAMWMVEKT